MNLKLATLEYVVLKQSMGMKFETEAALLRSFVKEMGDAVAVATVTSKEVLRYLNGRNSGPVTLFGASLLRVTPNDTKPPKEGVLSFRHTLDFEGVVWWT